MSIPNVIGFHVISELKVLYRGVETYIHSPFQPIFYFIEAKYMTRTLDVKELQPGMVLSEPIRKNDSTLYHKGRKLSLEDIVLLKSWRIPHVKVKPWSLQKKYPST